MISARSKKIILRRVKIASPLAKLIAAILVGIASVAAMVPSIRRAVGDVCDIILSKTFS